MAHASLTDVREHTAPVITPVGRAPERVEWGRSLLGRWRREIIVIVALAGTLPLLAAAHFHSLGQPMSDDWSYLASLSNLTQHGTLNLNHWASAFELGQLVLVSPLYLVFGVHPVLAVLWVWAIGLVGLFATAYLGRRCGVPRGAMLVLLAVLSICPLYFELSTTFMTDVPSFTFTILALCLWVNCTSRSRFDLRRWAALVLVTVAFTIREPMLFAAIPILGEPIIEARRRRQGARQRRLVVGTAIWVAMIGALWLWRNGLPTSSKSPLQVTVSALFEPWLSGWLPAMLGLFLLPVLVALSPWDLLPRLARPHRRTVIGLAVGLVLIPMMDVIRLVAVDPKSVQLGNIISLDAYMPVALRALLTLVGLLSFVAIVVILIGAHGMRSTVPSEQGRRVAGLTSVIAVYCAALLGGSVLGLIMWDRYWFVIVALGGIVLSSAGHQLRQAMGTPAHSTRLRRWTLVASLGCVVFYSLAVSADAEALRAGNYNFANEAAASLPSGDGPQDISVNLAWDGLAYQAVPSLSVQRLGPQNFRLISHDQSGAYLYFVQGGAGSCAPYSVRGSTGVQGFPAGTVLISPPSRGLFVSMRFALVKQPSGHPCEPYF